MFQRFREFARRHRYKLLVTAALGGGAYLLKWYAERRLRQWTEDESARMMDKVKKQAHFESTRATCAASLSRLTPRLLSALTRLLDTDAPLEALRSGAPNKLAVWNDLKRVSLQRVVASVYASSYLAVLLHVQVHALGGCLYVDSVRRLLGEGETGEPLDEPAQERYLAGIEHLLTEGLQQLVLELTPLLAPLADALPLTGRLGLEGVETLLWKCQEVVEAQPGLTLARLAVPPPQQPADAEPGRLQRLTVETRDLVATAEVDALVRECTRAGLAQVLDLLVPSFSGDGGGAEGFTAPHASQRPVAKLVPVLAQLPHQLLRRGQDSLPWLLANMQKVQVLAANVYESFSEV